MKILVAGDTHGFEKDIVRLCNLAGERKISHILQVGDFGLWTHKADGHVFLDDAQKAAEANNVNIFAIGGNHENWDHWNWFVDNMPTHKGFAMVRRRVLIAPKAHTWSWDNKRFIGVGGAVSIDKDYRLAVERGISNINANVFTKGTGARTLYWPNEQFTDNDVEIIRNMHYTNVDYLISHDCSAYTQFQGRLKPDADSQIHRERIDKVMKIVKPKMHFHGHMHTRYEWDNPYPWGYEPFGEVTNVTKTYGLEESRMPDSWGVLDTSTNEFAFQGEGMTFRSLQ